VSTFKLGLEYKQKSEIPQFNRASQTWTRAWIRYATCKSRSHDQFLYPVPLDSTTTKCGILWTRWWTVGFCKRRGPSKPDLHNSQCREILKYGRESRGTRNQQWLCWRGPEAIYQTDKLDERIVASQGDPCWWSFVFVAYDGLWAGWPKFDSGRGDISLIHSVQTGSGAHQASYPMGTEDSFLVGKAAGEWSWPLTFSKCRDQERWSYTSTPAYVFTVSCPCALRHEGVWRSGCIDPHFLDLGTSWRWVVSFRPRPLYPRGNSPRYALDRRLGAPQSRSGRCGEEKILDPTETWNPTPRSSSP
jgi:hypothetical protein